MLRPETLNVIQLGVGFFFIFFAFNSQGFIEESVVDSAHDRQDISSKHAGYYSLSIIYAVFTVANFIASPVVEVLGPKWAMVLGGLCYTAFQAGFLKLSQTYLYISSAVLGLGAAIIWTGQGTYLSRNCTERTSARNSGMLWGISQGCMFAGGIFLYIVFHSSENNDNISLSTTRTLYGVFTAVSLLGCLVLGLLRRPPPNLNPDKEDEATKPKISQYELLVSTFRLAGTKKMILLAFVFAYTGIELSFWSGIYPTCISFTKKLGSNTNALLALNSICQGAGQVVGGGVFGILGARTKKLGRDVVIFFAAIVHLFVFVAVYINIPAQSPLKKNEDSGALIDPSVPIALVCGFFLALGDACWNTQIYSLLVASYPNHSSQAFALYKFYQSGLSCAAFYYGSHLELQWHLAIMVVTSLIAAVAFFAVERLNRRDQVADASNIENNAKIQRQETNSMPPPPESLTKTSTDETSQPSQERETELKPVANGESSWT